jgi:hypothetical protein
MSASAEASFVAEFVRRTRGSLAHLELSLDPRQERTVRQCFFLPDQGLAP